MATNEEVNGKITDAVSQTAVGVLADYWDNCYVDDTYYHNGQPQQYEG